MDLATSLHSMKSFTFTMRNVGCLALFALTVVDQARAESLPREAVRILVLKQMAPGDVDGWNARQRVLQTRPDIKPDLFAMLDEALEKQNWELLGPPLLAIRLRSDLMPEELARLVNPLTVYAEKSVSLDMMERVFVCGALPVLKHYPNEENEKLALAFLGKDDDLIRENAVNTLAAIGTEQALPALRKLQEKLRPAAPDNKSRYYNEAVEAVSQIEERIKDRILRPAKFSDSSTLTGSVPKEKPSETNAPNRETNTTFTWCVGTVLTVAALSLLGLLLKNRK